MSRVGIRERVLKSACMLIVLAVSTESCVQAEAGPEDMVAICRDYLTATEERKTELSPGIAGYDGDIDAVVEILSRQNRSLQDRVNGELARQTFTEPGLKARYDEDQLHYFVPHTYTGERPFGLLIFMHGGGPTTPRDHPLRIISDPEVDPQSIGLQSHFRDLPMIVVAPSAPWNETTGARWNVPEADAYIAAVIQECCCRFNIDTDRVILGGYSMGGFGAFHLCQRLSDHLAGGFVFSGAWKTTYWPAWTGLPMFIRHGRHDASPPGEVDKSGRPRFTDVFYSRTADQRLTELDIPHHYVEDDGGHAIQDAPEALAKLTKWAVAQKRNRHPRHVVAVSPRGWRSASDTPTLHRSWITIHEIGAGEIPFDTVQIEGPRPGWNETAEDFQKQSLHMKKQPVTAGLVDARIESDNRIVLQSKNVKLLSIWCDRELLDFSRPVVLSLNGNETIHNVRPNLMTALRSYERWHDWGLVYAAEIEISCQE